MSEESTELPELQVLGAQARRAVGAARSEARQLGHTRIGTEHLLLGVLQDESSDATRALKAAGAGRAAVWSKVREARPPEPGVATEVVPDEATPRAARALRRSVRFSHQRRTNEVTPEDLLIGVLDVEGTAGQVLRSLGVDLDDLRADLTGEGTDPAGGSRIVAPCCPSCGADLSGSLTHRRVRSVGDTGVHEVLVHACSTCDAAIGTTTV